MRGGVFPTMLLVAGVSFAADPKISQLQLVQDESSVDIIFDMPLIKKKEPTFAADCSLKNPAGLQVGKSFYSKDAIDSVTILFNRPPKDQEEIEVLCASVDYTGPAGNKLTVKGLTTKTKFDPVTNVKQYLDNIDKSRKSAKKQNEKDIFVSGFVTTASGGSAGGADISLNPDLHIKDVKSFLQIKKTTLAGGDAKNFEAGARYQHFFLSDRKAYAALQGHSNLGAAELKRILKENSTHSPYSRVFIGSTADAAFKMEGAAGKFDVTNFVGDSAFTMRTKTGAFFNRQGFIRGFITPFAFEGGQSHANQSAAIAAGKPAIQPDWIARYKAGLGFRLHFADPKGQSLLQRVELSGDGVFRDLFYQESMWDEKAKAVNKTGKGIRGYGQIDLKVYLGESATALYGLKLSYNRGSLPPVFARVKSFQFGFLYESKD